MSLAQATSYQIVQDCCNILLCEGRSKSIPARIDSRRNKKRDDPNATTRWAAPPHGYHSARPPAPSSSAPSDMALVCGYTSRDRVGDAARHETALGRIGRLLGRFPDRALPLFRWAGLSPLQNDQKSKRRVVCLVRHPALRDSIFIRRAKSRRI